MEQPASDGGDQRRRVLCFGSTLADVHLVPRWPLPESLPSHRTRLRLQISHRTTSSLSPGSVRTDRAVRRTQEARSARRGGRLAYGYILLSSVVSENPQLQRWFSQAGPPETPAGEAALSPRLASVQPHLARVSGGPAWLGASG